MQIKVTTCFLYTSISMIKIKKIDNIKYGEATGTLTDGNINVTTLGNILTVSYEIKPVQSHDLAILLLNIYPRGIKTYIQTNTCISLLIEVLFIISPTWKQPKYPIAVE